MIQCTLEASLREGSPSLFTRRVSSRASPSGFSRSSSHAARSARSFTHSREAFDADSRAAMNAVYLHI
jgi:hypothetical protein